MFVDVQLGVAAKRPSPRLGIFRDSEPPAMQSRAWEAPAEARRLRHPPLESGASHLSRGEGRLARRAS
eukprot:14255145-Alexandrium_andersonii.AAC.1